MRWALFAPFYLDMPLPTPGLYIVILEFMGGCDRIAMRGEDVKGGSSGGFGCRQLSHCIGLDRGHYPEELKPQQGSKRRALHLFTYSEVPILKVGLKDKVKGARKDLLGFCRPSGRTTYRRRETQYSVRKVRESF